MWMLLLACGTESDPVVEEVCGSGGDEDADGLVDCEDGDCWGDAACPEVTVDVDEGDARWVYARHHYFESDGNNNSLEVENMAGWLTRRTHSGSTVCSFTADRFFVMRRASQYGDRSVTSSVEGFASSGDCGFDGTVLQPGLLGSEENSWGDLSPVPVFGVSARTPAVQASGNPWLGGTFSTSSSTQTSSSSGLGHKTTFIGEGSLVQHSPWVRRPF